MIDKIVNTINGKLCECLSGAKVYGLTQLLKRENLTIPAEVSATGEGTEVVVNDAYPVIAYHRQQSVTSSLQFTGNNGYGDDVGRYNNVHTMALFIYFNRARVNMLQDDVFLAVQGAINFITQSIQPFNSVQVAVTGAVLNDETVWNSEYTTNTKYRLPPNSSLIQINYSITTNFRTNCFACQPCN